VVGEGVDWATNNLIRQMNVPDVQDLQGLFKKAMREIGAPVSIMIKRATVAA
jgi:hypothetical protein